MTLKLGKTELWFFNNALLLNEIYLPTKFHVDISHTFRVMSRTKFKCKNNQRAIIQKLDTAELWFLCTANLLNEIYLPTGFHVDTSYSLRVMSWTLCSKCKNKQRAIIQNLGKAELRFMCNALLLNEIYLPTKCHVDTSYTFRVMSRTNFKV
jgi:hypothetical protein